MGQRSRVEPSNPMSPATALHPVLSSALANLDIQLEDELARYRRQRIVAGRGVRQPGRKQPTNQLDLIAVSATSDRGIAAPNAQTAPALEERLNGVASSPSIEPDTYKPIPAFTASPQPFEAAIALRKPEQPTHDGSAEKILPSEGDNDYALAQAVNPNLDDYLESSEELLRSLADEQAEVRAERSVMQSLLTPLGLGSMLLLLLSSAMFGYVIMNPSSLSWLTVKRNPVEAPGQNPGQAVIAPPQPDLAKRELPELNLNNLGTVNVNPAISPSPTTTAQTATVPGSKPTIAAAKAPAAGSQTTSEAAASAQAPIPAVTSSTRSSYPTRTIAPPQPASNPRPVGPLVPSTRTVPTISAPVTASNRGSGSTDGYQYKVGIPFENDQTLENARKVVPDAFVRTLPDGKTIVQVGAARSEAEVKANMQGLRDQGLSSAEVYKR